MILGMNPQQRRESGGFRTVHQSMPNLTAWNGIGSPPQTGNPFLQPQRRNPQPQHTASHKRVRDSNDDDDSNNCNHQFQQQRQQQIQKAQHESSFSSSRQAWQSSSSSSPPPPPVQWVPIDRPLSASAHESRGKKCRANGYRAPTKVQATVTSVMGSLVGGAFQPTQTTVHIRRQLSGSQLDQFVGTDAMEEDKLAAPERERSMSF